MRRLPSDWYEVVRSCVFLVSVSHAIHGRVEERAANDRRHGIHMRKSKHRNRNGMCVRDVKERSVYDAPITLHRAVSFEPSVRYRRMEWFQVSSNTITSVSRQITLYSVEMCQLVRSEYWWSEYRSTSRDRELMSFTRKQLNIKNWREKSQALQKPKSNPQRYFALVAESSNRCVIGKCVNNEIISFCDRITLNVPIVVFGKWSRPKPKISTDRLKSIATRFLACAVKWRIGCEKNSRKNCCIFSCNIVSIWPMMYWRE